MEYESWKTALLLRMYTTIKESLQYDRLHPPGRYGAREYLDLLGQIRSMEAVLDARGVEYERIAHD